MLRAGEYNVELSSMLVDTSNRVYALCAYGPTRKAVEGFAEAFAAAGKAEFIFNRGRGRKYVYCPRSDADCRFEKYLRTAAVRTFLAAIAIAGISGMEIRSSQRHIMTHGAM